MIIYSESLKQFVDDVNLNRITKKIVEGYLRRFHKLPGQSEKNSWNNSLNFVKNAITINNFSDDCWVGVEYSSKIMESKRIDFVLFGINKEDKHNFVVVELKQWNKAEYKNKMELIDLHEAKVSTFVAKAERDVLHPSYQAKSYFRSIKDFTDNIDDINGSGVSYLHNADKENNTCLIENPFSELVKECAIFFSNDVEKFSNYMFERAGYGKGKEIFDRIENGVLKPSKDIVKLAKNVLDNKDEYHLYENQKIIHDKILSDVINNTSNKKNIFIINGEPGTGKTVLAINLLSKFISNSLSGFYITPNSSLRNCISKQIDSKNHSFRNLFSGSSSFFKSTENSLDFAVVDEAHRLKEKAYMYKGNNQIEDIIKTFKNVVFFVDENQVIRKNDIGYADNIIKIANKYNCDIKYGEEWEIDIQFRCAGQQGYINWLSNVLQIKETSNYNFDGYDFEIYDNPNYLLEDMKQFILKNPGKSARILAGYAWKWNKKEIKKGEILPNDVSIPEYNFHLPWNNPNIDNWAHHQSTQFEVGCIHTTQGLEFDSAYVIIGKDIYLDENNNVVCSKDNYKDIAGKTGSTQEDLNKYVKNIYKVLLTRGKFSTKVFIHDERLRERFKSMLNK